MSVYCAREFSAQDLQTIQGLLAQTPALNRTDLSRRLCEQLNWRKPNGELKDMTCRVALLRMQADGLIALPPSREPAPRIKKKPVRRASDLIFVCAGHPATSAQPFGMSLSIFTISFGILSFVTSRQNLMRSAFTPTIFLDSTYICVVSP